jgi:hypothetical protein
MEVGNATRYSLAGRMRPLEHLIDFKLFARIATSISIGQTWNLIAPFCLSGNQLTKPSESETEVKCMNVNSLDQNAISTAGNAVFASLREKLAREVSGSAMLADLLEKLNKMAEAHTRPGEFKERFDEFVARAAEHPDLVQPFLPQLVCFLPECTEHPFESRIIEHHSESELRWDVA